MTRERTRRDEIIEALRATPFDGRTGQTQAARLMDGPPSRMDEIITSLRRGTPREQHRDTPGVGFVEGLAKTAAFDATLGMFGVREPESVETFKREHPLVGLAASFAGMAIPYGVGFKFSPLVAAKLPLLSRGMKFARDDKIHPFVQGAVGGAVGMTPFELTRLAGAAVVGDEGALRQVTAEAAFELGFIGTLGGAGQAIAKAAPFAGRKFGDEGRIARTFEEYLPNETPQFRLDQIEKILNKTPKVKEDEILYQALLSTRSRLTGEVVEQIPDKGKAYVQTISDKGALASKLSTLFRKGWKDARITQIPNTTDPKLRAYVEKIVEKATPGTSVENFMAAVQFPRVIQAQSTTGSAKLWERMLKSFGGKQVGIGREEMWLAREADGVFIVAKRLKGIQGTPGRPETWGADDVYLLAKTTKPEMFNPSAAKFGKLPLQGSFNTEMVKRLENGIEKSSDARFLYNYMKSMTNRTFRGPISAKIAKAVESALGDDLAVLAEQGTKGIAGLKERLKFYASPALFEGSSDPEFIMLLNAARMMHQRGSARASAFFYGKVIDKDTGNLFTQIMGKQERLGGLNKLIDDLEPQDIEAVIAAHLDDLSIPQVRSMYPSADRAVAYLRKSDQIGKSYDRQLVTLENIIGETKFIPKANHYMLSRSWFGNWRLPIYERGADGALTKSMVGVAPGYSRKQALENGEKMLAEMGDDAKNYGFLKNDVESVGFQKDLELANAVNLTRASSKKFHDAYKSVLKKNRASTDPVRFKERKRVLGFKKDLDKESLKNMQLGHMIERERIIQENISMHILEPHILKLQQRDPKLAEQLNNRMLQMAGAKSEMWKGVDSLIDPILAPIAGRNAASNIVGGINKHLFSFTLGFGDLGFAAINAMTPIITVLPEIAYTLTALPKSQMRYYSYALAMDAKGAPVTMRHLDPIRILTASIRDMSKPTPELRKAIKWGLERGHIDPKYVEEFVGQDASVLRDWRGMLTGNQGIVTWLDSLSKFMPIQSEKFTRGVSFISGYNVGKLKGLKDEQLLQFAAEFTARTNFLYGTSDRARVITGSVGTLFGLFKNWGMHQVGNMLTYAGDAALRRNIPPLMWMMGTTGAIGGVGAMPFYGMADSASRAMTDEGLKDNLYDFGGWVGAPTKVMDTFQYGFPALFGIALQGRVAPTGVEVARDVNFLFQSALLDRMGMLTDALGTSLSQWKDTGIHPLANEGNRLKYYRALLPRTLYRAMSFTEENALRSLQTGNALMGPATMSQRASFVLGLNPLEFEKSLEISNDMWQDEKKRSEATSNFGRAWHDAEKRQDMKEQLWLLRRMIYDGIPWDSVMRSADAFEENENVGQAERQFDAYLVLEQKRRFGLK